MDSNDYGIDWPYISGPMSGIADHNFPLFFAVEDALRKAGMDPVNPARTLPSQTWQEASLEALEDPQTWNWYIKRDIENLMACDSVIVLPGWEKSKGACLEVVVAINCGYPVYFWGGTIDGKVILTTQHRGFFYADAMKHLRDCGINGVAKNDYVQATSD